MRIHEVLDACVEYVAYDGIIGSDVISLQQHLAKQDPSIDATYFAYLYRLLCQHSSIRIAISTVPIPSVDRSVQLGSEPLPDDYTPPDSAADFENGIRKRGRDMVFHLAGEQPEVERKKSRSEGSKKKERILGSEGEVLLTFVDADGDLSGLLEKWGNRLRIRCTEDEIYYRLTGSHQKIPKFTAAVMHTLQLSARARETGITAVELGPIVGASQGSIYYYMKVLIDAGLCAKIPAVLHGAMTNLLIFHPFLLLNGNYRAVKKLGPILKPTPEDDPAIGDAAGSDFSPLTEPEVMTGHIVKERLLLLLAHPGLQNHLLRYQNLLDLVGWKDPIEVRHRRALVRHVATLVMSGVVERIEVGSKRVECLRLTKFNPDYVPRTEKAVAVEEELQVVHQSKDFSTPYHHHGGIAINITLERQFIEAIVEAGIKGITYIQLRDILDGCYRRNIEFLHLRAERSWHIPHMRDTALTSVIESASRERRLRVFTIPACRAFILAAGQNADDKKHPAMIGEAGRWAPLDYQSFARDAEDFWRKAAGGKEIKEGKNKRARSESDSESDTPAVPAKKAARRYKNDIQVRGRPRKYIHVVDEEGTVKRHVLGQIYPHPDIPPILIFIASSNKLVPASLDYTGLGKPAKVTAEQLKQARSPKFYDKYPKFYYKGSTKQRKGKSGNATDEEGEEDVVEVEPKEAEAPAKKRKKGGVVSNEDGEQAIVEPKGKKAAKVKGGDASNEEGEEAIVQPKGKKAKEAAKGKKGEGATENATAEKGKKAKDPVKVKKMTKKELKQKEEEASAKKGEELPASKKSSQLAKAVDVPLVEDVEDVIEGVTEGVMEDVIEKEAVQEAVQEEPRPAPASPLQSVNPIPDTTPPVEPPRKRQKRAPKAGDEPQPIADARRVNLSIIRRNHELIEVLRLAGPILTDTKFMNAHREWTQRVGGTDAPFAPGVAYQMDRRVFNNAVPILEEEGRLKSTICTIATATGRWIKQPIYWLPDTPRPLVDAYISSLAEATTSSLKLARDKRTRIEDQAFSTALVPKGVVAPKPKLVMPDDTPAAIRRSALLKSPGVASSLLGYISGRWARVRRFLEGLMEVLEGRPKGPPFVFALPLIFEDITIGDFYECMFITTYDEDLDEYLSDPANRRTPLRDVPIHLRPAKGGFAGAGYRQRYRAILSTLVQLGIVTPLVPSPLETADFTLASDQTYRTAEVVQATHFVVHTHAPVYHIAGEQAGLLGVLPITTAEERDVFWETTQDACLKSDIDALPKLSCDAPIGLPQTAQITDELHLEPELRKTMRSAARWRKDKRLLEEQRDAIDHQIDWRRGQVLLSEEEIESFAYENALSVPFVKEELARRASQAKQRIDRVAKREADSAKASKAKRIKSQQTLREKLAELRATSKKEWEDRIEKACAIMEVEYTRDVVSFVTHHALSVPNRTKLSDSAIQDAVRLSTKVQLAQTMTGVVKPKKTIWEVSSGGKQSGQRRRHAWTPSEDDLLLDCEAIVRARSRGKQRGRMAIHQIFTNFAPQPLLNRFKKLVAIPGKQQYFDRLEQAWHDLWTIHRGFELVDEDPDSTTEFDLKHHVEFLRARINKTHLRNGYVEESVATVKAADLPLDHAKLVKDSEWRYGKSEVHTIFSVTEKEISDEAKLSGYAMVSFREESPVKPLAVQRERGIIRACLKMIVITPNEVYDQAAATEFLSPFPTPARVVELNSLVDDRILIKQHTAAHTSRHYGYTAVWNMWTDGPLSGDLHDEAKAMRSKVGEGMEYSSVMTGGDVASLCEMVSDGTVDIGYNVSDFRPVTYLRNSYNTRRLDDDAFEFPLNVKANAALSATTPVIPLPQLEPTLSAWPPMPDIDVAPILDLVHNAGPDGLTRAELHIQSGYSTPDLLAAYASLAMDSTPEVFWAGYDTARLVSAKHWDAWTHPIDGARIRPRRWTDIFGNMTEDWKRCLRCVATNITTRPGILISDFRSRMGLILDRMEMTEILQYLEEAGAIQRKWINSGDIIPPIEAMSPEEENEVGIWPGDPWVL